MKRNTHHLFKQLNIQQVTNLTTIVKESLAVEFSCAKNKIFSTADLWNIQRYKKPIKRQKFSF